MEALNKLVEQACAQDTDFKQRLHYWLIKRKRPVEMKWLLNKLALSLGEEVVISYLNEQLNVKNEQVLNNG